LDGRSDKPIPDMVRKYATVRMSRAPLQMLDAQNAALEAEAEQRRLLTITRLFEEEKKNIVTRMEKDREQDNDILELQLEILAEEEIRRREEELLEAWEKEAEREASEMEVEQLRENIQMLQDTEDMYLERIAELKAEIAEGERRQREADQRLAAVNRQTEWAKIELESTKKYVLQVQQTDIDSGLNLELPLLHSTLISVVVLNEKRQRFGRILLFPPIINHIQTSEVLPYFSPQVDTLTLKLFQHSESGTKADNPALVLEVRTLMNAIHEQFEEWRISQLELIQQLDDNLALIPFPSFEVQEDQIPQDVTLDAVLSVIDAITQEYEGISGETMNALAQLQNVFSQFVEIMSGVDSTSIDILNLTGIMGRLQDLTVEEVLQLKELDVNDIPLYPISMDFRSISYHLESCWSPMNTEQDHLDRLEVELHTYVYPVIRNYLEKKMDEVKEVMESSRLRYERCVSMTKDVVYENEVSSRKRSLKSQNWVKKLKTKSDLSCPLYWSKASSKSKMNFTSCPEMNEEMNAILNEPRNPRCDISVTSVHRLENPKLWKTYATCRRVLSKQAKHPVFPLDSVPLMKKINVSRYELKKKVNEMYLLRLADPFSVEFNEIIANGFTQMQEGPCGPGIAFRDSMLAFSGDLLGPNPILQVFVSRVVLGTAFKISNFEDSTLDAPEGDNFNSLVLPAGDGALEYWAAQVSLAYPEYLVTFKIIEHVTEDANAEHNHGEELGEGEHEGDICTSEEGSPSDRSHLSVPQSHGATGSNEREDESAVAPSGKADKKKSKKPKKSPRENDDGKAEDSDNKRRSSKLGRRNTATADQYSFPTSPRKSINLGILPTPVSTTSPASPAVTSSRSGSSVRDNPKSKH